VFLNISNHTIVILSAQQVGNLTGGEVSPNGLTLPATTFGTIAKWFHSSGERRQRLASMRRLRGTMSASSSSNMTFVNFTLTGSEGPEATNKLLNTTALELLENLGASGLTVTYQTVVNTTTDLPSTTQAPATGDGVGDDGLSEENLILAIVLPIVGVMLIAALVYCCVVKNRRSDHASRSFAFGTRKEEIKFDEYLAIIDGPAEMMNLEERML
jgi:hypothetical protein